MKSFKFQSGATAFRKSDVNLPAIVSFKFQSGATAFTNGSQVIVLYNHFKFQSGATAFRDVIESSERINNFKFQSGATAFKMPPLFVLYQTSLNSNLVRLHLRTYCRNLQCTIL